MKVSRTLTVVVVLAAGIAVPGPTGPRAMPTVAWAAAPLVALPEADRVFLTEAFLDELLGQTLGEQASVRPGGSRFASHATHLQEAHARRAEKARGVAVIHGVGVPTALDADRRALVAKLGARTGRSYEVAYARTALQLHLRIVERLQTQARSGDDADLRNDAALEVAPAMDLVRRSRALWEEMVPVGL